MRTGVIISGLRLLIAAVLCSLLALPAAAHSGHGHDASALTAALDALVDRANARDVGSGAQVIAASASALHSSSCCCCCGQSGYCEFSGCGSGLACESGSCSHVNGALALLSAARVAPSAKGEVACLSDQLLAGDAPGPDDRPPRL